MNRSEKLALFLGMLSGDGCLSVKYNGEGYRIYPIEFYNTRKELVFLFRKLFYELFGVEGKINLRMRKNRKEIWNFLKYSAETVEYLKNLGFPEGVKRDVLRVPRFIKKGNIKEKLSFIYGLSITDGSYKPKKGIMFHLGSKIFLEEISLLLEDILGVRKQVKEYIQKGKYKSYQLYLNKVERKYISSQMPLWHNGTALVLS